MTMRSLITKPVHMPEEGEAIEEDYGQRVNLDNEKVPEIANLKVGQTVQFLVQATVKSVSEDPIKREAGAADMMHTPRLRYEFKIEGVAFPSPEPDTPEKTTIGNPLVSYGVPQ